MLDYLKIENFKIWENTGPITMKPITLFFGVNSSGKSSIGQFLMMLKQTVESYDRKAVFYTGDRKSPVELGTYQEMVFHHDTNNDINFEYKWNLSNNIKIRDPEAGDLFIGSKLSFSALAGVKTQDQRSPILKRFKYIVLDDTDNTVLSVEMGLQPGGKIKYEVNTDIYELTKRRGRPWAQSAPIRFYGFPDEVVANYKNADFVKELNLRHERLFRSLFYLGPLRTKAERTYSWTGLEPESVGYDGSNTVGSILAARKRRISIGNRRPTKPFQQIIALKLQQMGLIDHFSVEPIAEHSQEYRVKVRIKGSNDLVDLTDVGFGVSQVLPVLVQCFYAPSESIIIIEQPEIHLHPSAQASLADVMIDVINSKEYGADRNIQLIIETHSEHFLRRLQRRIAENDELQDNVSAYFADINEMPVKLKHLQIDIFGSIRNWPKKFFGDEIGDITKHSKAAMIKRISQTKQKSSSR